MRTLESAFSNAINNYDQHLNVLIELELSNTYRYCDADIDLWYNSNKYEARGIQLNPARYSISMQIDKISIDFDNADKVFTDIVEGSEIRGKQTIVRAVTVSDIGKVISQEPIFTGVIDSANFDKEKATINVANMFIYWQREVPRRRYSPKCQHDFKNTSTCRYVGDETWCDKTYERCKTLGNTINFGGFRWISYLLNKDLYWGRTPK